MCYNYRDLIYQVPLDMGRKNSREADQNGG
jgi:hypothetical protein